MSEVVDRLKREILEIARREAETRDIPLCRALENIQDRLYRAAGEAMRRRRFAEAERSMQVVDLVREVERQQGCISHAWRGL